MDPLIKTEGVFRMSPRAMTVGILKEAYDRGQKFIVWKEGNVVLTHSHRREGFGDVWVDELDQCEGWEFHAAAGVIKQWYKELRDPIFPQSCYAGLERFYGSSDSFLETKQLLGILSPDTEWSPISKASRTILVMHLLPLLSRISDFSEFNRMTPQNLAVCFAPTLLRGPDPIEDVQISATIQRIIEAMVTHWNEDLAPHFQMDIYTFEESLRMPENPADREDPLDESQQVRSSLETQMTGITLIDNDDEDEDDTDREEDEALEPPPLPPRPAAISVEGTAQAESSVHFKRKPAPHVLPLPRYSMIVTERPANLGFHNSVPTDEDINPEAFSSEHLEELPEYAEEHSPYSNTVPTEHDVREDEEEQQQQRQFGGLPGYETRLPGSGMGIVRKPVAKGAGSGPQT